MKFAGIRQRKIGDLIREEIASAIVEGKIKDPRVHGLITVTKVDVTMDFKLARVYVSILEEEHNREKILKGLKSAAGFLRARIARYLKLRFTPDLEFKLDQSLDQHERIEYLLKAAKK